MFKLTTPDGKKLGAFSKLEDALKMASDLLAEYSEILLERIEFKDKILGESFVR
jgi:hypothetical protein